MPLLSEDSPITNPPRDLEPIQKAAVDALALTFDAAWASFQQLMHVLKFISEQLPSSKQQEDTEVRPPTRDATVAAFLSAWGLIDNAWRLHQTLRRMPRLKRAGHLKAHLRVLAAAEEFRHSVQHMDERFRESVEMATPIWGSLSWLWTPENPLQGGTVLTLVPGSIKSGKHFMVNPSSSQFHSPIGRITLSTFGKEIDLTTLGFRVKTIADGLDAGFRTAIGDLPRGGSDILVAAIFRFMGEDEVIDQ